MIVKLEMMTLSLFDYPPCHPRVEEEEQVDYEDSSGGKEVNSIFHLAVPFHNTSTVNLTERDIYLQESFENLIQERHNLNLPYFLAIIEDSSGLQQVFDATTFIRSYYKHDQKKSALTRQDIVEAQIYRIDSLKERIFQPFCSLSQLKIHHGHYVKIINACDPSLSPDLRGQERFYVASIFEDGMIYNGERLIYQNLERAFFWYQKSAEDQYFGGHIALAEWYENGNTIVEQSDDKLIEHLTQAANCIPSTEDKLSVDLYHSLAKIYFQKGDIVHSNQYIDLANRKINDSALKSSSIN